MIPVVGVLFFLVLLFLIFVGVVAAIFRAIGRRGQTQCLSDEEEEQLGRLIKTLDRMDQRIVNLETILGKQESDTRNN